MSSLPAVPQGCAQQAGWQARLRLRFAQREGHTYIAAKDHFGPLLVQRPFHPEPQACHTYLVHPPGGVVGGDRLQLEVEAGAGTHALLTTPAATKFYRSDGRQAQQLQRIRATNASVEWLPQESIFYRGAAVRSETRVELTAGSKFIGWEIPCLGLPARAERFDRGDLQLNFELWLEDVPVVLDLLRITGAGPGTQAAWGLGGFQAIGTLLAYPADQAMLELARTWEMPEGQLAVTRMDDVLVCRGLAAQAEPVKRLFIGLWAMLRPHVFGRPAVLPRIWAT